MPVVPRSISSAEPDSQFKMTNWINGKTIVSPTINTLKNKTQTECQNFCSADDQCLFSVYDNRSATCYLRGAETNSSASTGLKNEYSFDTLSSAYLPSSGILSLTSQGCAEKCRNDPNCDYYTILNNNCSTNSFQTDANYSMSIKLQSHNANPLNEADTIGMACCTNDPNNPNPSQCGTLFPFTKQCDTFMTELCQKNKYLPQCRCLNRTENTKYQAIKSKLPSNIRDECWFPYCQGNVEEGATSAYIPTEMIPTSITFYDNDGINKIDNIRCAGSVRCNIPDLLNPDLRANCPLIKSLSVEKFSNIESNDSMFWLTVIIIILIIILLVKKAQ